MRDDAFGVSHRFTGYRVFMRCQPVWHLYPNVFDTCTFVFWHLHRHFRRCHHVGTSSRYHHVGTRWYEQGELGILFTKPTNFNPAIGFEPGEAPEERSPRNPKFTHQLLVAGIAPTVCAVEMDAEQYCDPNLKQLKNVPSEDRAEPVVAALVP